MRTGSSRSKAGPRGFQSGLFALRLNHEPIDIEYGELGGLPDSVVNVAGVYAALRDNITQGSDNSDAHRARGFEHATRLSYLIDDVLGAAQQGRTATRTSQWP